MQNQNLKFYIQNSKKGFTLIEALIAIAVLTISIAGPITIASKGLSSAIFARDQITAFYLAQEAVEFIRNKRDENQIKGNGWLDGDINVCRNGNVCAIDITDLSIQQCTGGFGSCPILKYNSDTSFYNYKEGYNSIFTREVNLTKINNNEEEITVKLSWTTGAISKSFIVKEHIFDW